MISVSLPAMVANARNRTCENNLRLIGLGIHNYNAAYDRPPMGSGGTSSGSEALPTVGNANRLNGLVGVLPFMEEQTLWSLISNPRQKGEVKFPPMGPVPWHSPEEYEPWGMRPATFTCPDDPDWEKFSMASNYLFNYGDSVENVGAPWGESLAPYGASKATHRGIFARQHQIPLRDVLDGLSNTLMMSEGKINGAKVAKNIDGLIQHPLICNAIDKKPSTQFWPEGRDARWMDGSLMSSGFQTILPPNSRSCSSPKGVLEGIFSASSYHEGGVHVLMCDGQVKFISQGIDCGDLNKESVRGVEKAPAIGPPSPYGVWGALGTRSGKDVVPENALGKPVRSYSKADLNSFESYPIETWRTAKGDGSIQARQVDLVEDSTVVLLQDGKLRRIELLKIHEDDARRARQTHAKRVDQVFESLTTDLKLALNHLEQKEFELFLDECVFPEEVSINGANARFSTLAEIKRSRGSLITMLDRIIPAVPQIKVNSLQSGDQTTATFPLENGVPKFRALYVNGKWLLDL